VEKQDSSLQVVMLSATATTEHSWKLLPCNSTTRSTLKTTRQVFKHMCTCS
jgi:hypothetical protein